ncbi:MAG: HEPN domain-containing protein [Promethearchaeota archaeon]|nr:MAG: HEPN domain-containing protein [Candidatus Lokiarchaeota archaeon]
MKKNVKLWLEEAKWDYNNAKILLENDRYNTVVFTSQQAAEKAIKALLFYCNLNGWGHSIFSLLIKYKEKINREIEDIKSDALFLDKHYITTRYPDSLPGISPHIAYTKEEAKNSIEKAKKIIKFVENELTFFEEKKELKGKNELEDEKKQ